MHATATPTIEAPAPHDAPAGSRRSLYMVRLLHRGLRRDVTALADALARVRVGDPALPALRDWCRRFAEVVEHHQWTQDQLLWPAVTACDPAFAPVQHELAAAHEAIRPVIEDVLASLGVLAAGTADADALLAARRATRTFEALLCEQIDREAEVGLPAAAAVLDHEQLLDIDRASRRRCDPDLLAFLAPWVFDHATAEETLRIIDRTPDPIVALGRTVWRRRYERAARDVRRARAAGATTGARLPLRWSGNSGPASRTRP